MIYGIGCDLCDTARMAKSLGGPHGSTFAARVFGPAEREALGLSEGASSPLSAHKAASAAADFAAKEAFLKAAGTGLAGPFALCEIEAVRLESGAPEYRFSGGSARWMDERHLRAKLSQPRRRHGAGFLHSGDGSGNLTALCAYNGIRPAA